MDYERNRTVYARHSSASGWFVGIVVALALLAIGYWVFTANSDCAGTKLVCSTIVEPNA